MFDIQIHSRSSIETVITDKQFSVISVIEPMYRNDIVIDDDWNTEDINHLSFPKLASNKANCVSNLCLRFYDTFSVITTDEGFTITPITDNQAKTIALFVISCVEANIEELYINCAAGISRSSGIGAAISKFYTGDDQFYYDKYIPNRYVYMKVLEALHEIT